MKKNVLFVENEEEFFHRKKNVIITIFVKNQSYNL
jgi:hypothetical protein